MASHKVPRTCKRCGCQFQRRADRAGRFCSTQCAVLPFSIRFWAKVDKTPGFGPNGDCWKWNGGKNRKGYGAFAVQAQNGKWTSRGAHQVAYFLTAGEWTNENVCHSCDNRACVNPQHLWRGTTQENTADMVAKGRSAKGERMGAAKLTVEDVRFIRREYSPEKRNGAELARKFGVAHTTIYMVIRKERWTHA